MASVNLSRAREVSRAILAQERERLLALVKSVDVHPFQETLAEQLAHAKKINWARLARNDPDKYIKCLKDLALLAGYTPEAFKAAQSNLVIIERMSDNDLVQALAAARAQLAALGPLVQPVVQPESEPLEGVYKVASSVPPTPEEHNVAQSEQTPVSNTPSNERLNEEGEGTG